jgi:dipeptidyl aminopeptidase/acylaminoacyl peptidase
LAFSSTGSDAAISWMRSDGAVEPQRLIAAGPDASALIPWSFSPEGRRLSYHASARTGGSDLWTVPLDLSDAGRPKPGVPEPLLRTTADEWAPQFSPDGRWIAYTSDESGEYEIYVRPSPDGTGAKWQISRGGGRYAFWSKDSRELFYETGDNRIMVVDYRVENGSFVPGKARVWYDKPLFNIGSVNLDLAADSRRFVVLSFPEAAPAAKRSVHVTMLFSFLDELKRRIR